MEQNNYIVYLHIFPNNKKYVGITKQTVEQRWQNGNGYKKQPVYEAIEKFGWDNIKHKIIRTGLSLEQAQNIEKELIEFYDSINNGYNSDKGGGAGGSPWVEIEYNGIIYSAEEIAEMSLSEITAHDITTRVRYHKWDIEKAMTTPKIEKDRKFLYKDCLYTINELYEIRINKELTKSQIKNRLLKHNWEVERSITQPNNIKKQPKGVGSCVFVYQGKEYNSYELTQISTVPNLTPQDITDRINRKGWSIVRAITQPKRER